MNNVLSFQDNLVYRAWTAAKPKVVLLAIHGIGAHSMRWNFLGAYLAQKNISTYALELRGNGDNHLSYPVYNFQKFHTDIQEMYRIIRKKQPKTKIVLIGESMGGLISFNYAAHHPELDGLICLSPAFQSLLKFRWWEYFLLPWLLILPRWPIKLHFSAQMCTADNDVQKYLSRDRRESRTVPGGLLIAILFAQMQSAKDVEKIKIPVLFQLAGNDVMVSTAKSKEVLQKISSAKKIITYAKMRHALSIEKNRATVFQDILHWLEDL